MCGIAGFAGQRPASPFLMDALKKLEYRGYDSWGIAVYDQENRKTRVVHSLGGPSTSTPPRGLPTGTCGIGHTRWATHGKVCLANTHPIAGGLGKTPTDCYVVHNGIITNHDWNRAFLQKLNGYVFKTDTDTEVIAHLFDATYLHQLQIYDGVITPLRVVLAMKQNLDGEYSFAIISSRFPNKLIAFCNGSPLVVGEGGYIASDVNTLAGYTAKCYHMKKGECVVIEDGIAKNGGTHPLVYDDTVPAPTSNGLDGHAHYMHKEIFEQVKLLNTQPVPMPRFIDARPDKVVLFGCGSSYHAAALGRHYIEDLASVPCQIEYATELESRKIFGTNNTIWIGLTQSGETKDILVAMERIASVPQFKDNLYVVTNNVNSSAARLARVLDLKCGVERGVAATKTFTAQASKLLEIACRLSIKMNLTHGTSMVAAAKAIESVLSQETELILLAAHTAAWKNILFLARGMLYPVAKEGALKMKEVSYHHAEAIHASEMKHGPIALIDKDTLSLFLLTSQDEDHISKVLSNIKEIDARHGKVIVIADKSVAPRLDKLARTFILPDVPPVAQPIVVAVALQLLAYHVALKSNINVDKPRNLAKSVTVE